ncbi:MAG: ATP-dependent Clp protease proteolytic subunit, partial [Pseudomonadota bacterium]
MADLVHNGELHLFGIVGGDLYWDEGFTDTDVTAALANMSGPLIVRLNSPGGIVSHGNAIHHALADYDGEVTLYVEAQAYSAASVIAMAADTIIMRTGSMMM